MTGLTIRQSENAGLEDSVVAIYTCVRMAVNKMTATLLVALLLAAGRFSQCYSGSDTTERGHETGIYILLYSMRLCNLHCP